MTIDPIFRLLTIITIPVSHGEIQQMKNTIPQALENATRSQAPTWAQILSCACISLSIVWTAGCHHRQQIYFDSSAQPCQNYLQEIDYPDLADDFSTDGTDLMSPAPVTLSSFQEMQSVMLTIDECVQLALRNSTIMQKLGGTVVNAPQAAISSIDQAIQETNPQQSVEAALSAFDASVNSGLVFTHVETPNIGATAIFGATKVDGANYNFNLAKQTATGATYTLTNTIDYSRLGAINPFVPFRSDYDFASIFQVRQPLGRGRGAQVTRIAGPNATPGNYNGVLLARLRSDISLADFESSVRDLVRDVETNYWELYFAYRDLDTKILARDSARETWENRQLRFENGVGRPDDEAQARQQYYNFETQVQSALTGVLNGQLGVVGAERNLRRLLGLPVNTGEMIRPASDPTTAPVIFDWQESQLQSLARRVELRRQKWTIRQRELEFLAAKQLNRWQVDLVGQYSFKGFGDNLFGSRDRSNGSAVADFFAGDLDDWQLGLEVNGAIGNRQGHLAIRNAELNLRREKAILKEQQRQILHDLGAAFVEVDRAFQSMKSTANNRIAVQEELEPKQKRVEAGQDQIFFLLDAQQRAATAESSLHRSILDYNRSLLNYVYTTGSLLSRYNIVLTEDRWCDDAYCRAKVKASRVLVLSEENCNVDNCPVSSERYPQDLPPVASSTYQNGFDDLQQPQESFAVPFDNESDDLEDSPSDDLDLRSDDLDLSPQDSFDSDSVLEGDSMLEDPPSPDDGVLEGQEYNGSIDEQTNRWNVHESRLFSRRKKFTREASTFPKASVLRGKPEPNLNLDEVNPNTIREAKLPSVGVPGVNQPGVRSILERASYNQPVAPKENVNTTR